MTKSSGTDQSTRLVSSPIGCVIMASGLGRRFGGNKLLADFRGKPMISYILELTGQFSVLTPLVVTRHETVAAICREKGVDVLCHELPHRSDTVRLGLERLLPLGLQGCLFCPSDQPLLRPESLEALLHAFSQNPDKICRLSFGEKAASPVLFGRRFFPELLTLPQGAGGSYLAKKYPEQVILVPVQDIYELSDVDTPEDLNSISWLAKRDSV